MGHTRITGKQHRVQRGWVQRGPSAHTRSGLRSLCMRGRMLGLKSGVHATHLVCMLNPCRERRAVRVGPIAAHSEAQGSAAYKRDAKDAADENIRWGLVCSCAAIGALLCACCAATLLALGCS